MNNPYQKLDMGSGHDCHIDYVNYHKGIRSTTDFQIPELWTTQPDLVIVAESGTGNLEHQPPHLSPITKLARWGLQIYARG